MSDSTLNIWAALMRLPYLDKTLRDSNSLKGKVFTALNDILNSSPVTRGDMIRKYQHELYDEFSDRQRELFCKVAFDHNIFALKNILLTFEPYHRLAEVYWHSILNTVPDYEHISHDWYTIGQLSSKQTIIDIIKTHEISLGTVYLLGGWYGTLASMFEVNDIQLDKIRSFDIDPSCEDIARNFNKKWLMKDWKFQATTIDVNDLEFSPCRYTVKRADGTAVNIEETPTTIINTSSEHMDNSWFNNVPYGTTVIIQNNDFFDCDGHINCVHDLDELRKRYPLSTEISATELPTDLYNRFTLVGIK